MTELPRLTRFRALRNTRLRVLKVSSKGATGLSPGQKRTCHESYKTERLLAAARFTDFAEVEFKKDPRHGRFKVLDVSPRVWGSHTLSVRAGVDFSYLLWLLVRGERVPISQARVGERWIHGSADLRVAIGEILNGGFSLASYLRSMRGLKESAIFAWDDPLHPLPGLLDLPPFAYSLGKRAAKSKEP